MSETLWGNGERNQMSSFHERRSKARVDYEINEFVDDQIRLRETVPSMGEKVAEARYNENVCYDIGSQPCIDDRLYRKVP